MNFSMLISFGIYVLFLLIIGYRASRGRRASTDLVLGERSVNWWVTAISAQAADMSSWLFMGLPAAIYLHGAIDIWVAVGLIVGMWASWHFLAAPIRRETEQYHASTLPSYFENKYHESAGRISAVSAGIMALFFTLYIAAGIKGVGYILEGTFGLSRFWGGIMTVVVTLIYTLMGGFVAAAWVDFFQGIFLLGAILLTTIVAYAHVGGYSAIMSAVQSHQLPFSFSLSLKTILAIIAGPVAWGLGYFGMPHILSKFMGAENPEQLYKSKYVGIIWQSVALSAAIMCGFIGLAYFSQPLSSPEKTLFITMAIELFPATVAGLIICGILSATLSTMNAQMLVLAGIVSQDLFHKLYAPHATRNELKQVFRAVIIAVAFVAFLIAWFDSGTIFDLVEFAWGGLGASFGPLTILALYNAPVTKEGALAGIIAGGVTSLCWNMMHYEPYGIHINDVVPGFIVGTLVILVISRIYIKRQKQ